MLFSHLVSLLRATALPPQGRIRLASVTMASSSNQLQLYDLHRGMMSQYLGQSGGGGVGTTDIEILQRNYRFIMDDDEDEGGRPAGWERRMAKRYYDK